MELATQVQILDKVVHISLCANAFAKSMHPSCSLFSYGKYLGQLCSLALVRQLVWEKKNPRFKPALLCLKSDLVSHPACGGEVV